MSNLKLSSFKLSPEDNRKLDELVQDAKNREVNSTFPLRINRTSVIQQLISLAHAALSDEQARINASTARAKKRMKKNKAKESQPLLA